MNIKFVVNKISLTKIFGHKTFSLLYLKFVLINIFGPKIYFGYKKFLTQSCWHKCWCCSRSPFRQLTGNVVSGLLFSSFSLFFYLFFHFFHFSVTTFLIERRRAPQIKKLILRKLTGAPKNQGKIPFQTQSVALPAKLVSKSCQA